MVKVRCMAAQIIHGSDGGVETSDLSLLREGLNTAESGGSKHFHVEWMDRDGSYQPAGVFPARLHPCTKTSCDLEHPTSSGTSLTTSTHTIVVHGHHAQRAWRKALDTSSASQEAYDKGYSEGYEDAKEEYE